MSGKVKRGPAGRKKEEGDRLILGLDLSTYNIIKITDLYNTTRYHGTTVIYTPDVRHLWAALIISTSNLTVWNTKCEVRSAKCIQPIGLEYKSRAYPMQIVGDSSVSILGIALFLAAVIASDSEQPQPPLANSRIRSNIEAPYLLSICYYTVYGNNFCP